MIVKGENMQGYKHGASINDRNAIKRMQQEGKTSAEISRALLIIEPCVASFMAPPKKAKPKSKAKKEPVNDLPEPPEIA